MNINPHIAKLQNTCKSLVQSLQYDSKDTSSQKIEDFLKEKPFFKNPLDLTSLQKKEIIHAYQLLQTACHEQKWITKINDIIRPLLLTKTGEGEQFSGVIAPTSVGVILATLPYLEDSELIHLKRTYKRDGVLKQVIDKEIDLRKID